MLTDPVEDDVLVPLPMLSGSTMTAQRQETNRNGRGGAFIALLAGLLSAAVALAAQAATTERLVTDRFSGLAIDGFDPVAYFTDAAPLAGRPDFEAGPARADLRVPPEGKPRAFLRHPAVH